MKVQYAEFHPSPMLSQLVDLYWFSSCDGNPSEISPVQYCLPSGMVELIVHLSDDRSQGMVDGCWETFPKSLLVGVMEVPVIWKMPGGTSMFGIRFKPEGISSWLQLRISELANSFIDTDLILDKQFNSMIRNIQEAKDHPNRISLVEAYLENQLSRFQDRHLCFYNAINLIRNGVPGYSITDLSREVCISERQLQRIFKNQLGVGPKSYSRIIRFRRIKQFLQMNPRTSWVEIAFIFGYADQAHFIRDFKAFSGKTPGCLLEN